MMEFDALSLRDYDLSQHRFGGCKIDPELIGSVILINNRRKTVWKQEIVINQNDLDLSSELKNLTVLDKEYATYLYADAEKYKINFLNFCLRKLF